MLLSLLLLLTNAKNSIRVRYKKTKIYVFHHDSRLRITERDVFGSLGGWGEARNMYVLRRWGDLKKKWTIRDWYPVTLGTLYHRP